MKRPHPHTCPCKGSGWACEDHPDRAYGDTYTCPCDAPGMPCPAATNVTSIHRQTRKGAA